MSACSAPIRSSNTFLTSASVSKSANFLSKIFFMSIFSAGAFFPLPVSRRSLRAVLKKSLRLSISFLPFSRSSASSSAK